MSQETDELKASIYAKLSKLTGKLVKDDVFVLLDTVTGNIVVTTDNIDTLMQTFRIDPRTRVGFMDCLLRLGIAKTSTLVALNYSKLSEAMTPKSEDVSKNT